MKLLVPKQTYEENQLLALIARGDERAFEILYNQYRPKLFSAALLLTRNPDQAAELIQDVFLKIWMKRDQLHLIQSMEAYLFVAMRNEAYNWFSREAKRRKLVDADIGVRDVPVSIADDYILSREMAALLETGIRLLPEKQQQVFRMIRIEGMNKNEVASTLGIEVNTVRTHLGRAIKSLRAWIISQNIISFFVALSISGLCC